MGKELSTSVERRQLAAKRITKIYEMHGVPCFGGLNISTRTKISNRSGIARPPNQASKSTNPRTRQRLQLKNADISFAMQHQ